MEYYVAGAERPVDRCVRDAAECDLYIGIFAWRYGYIPPGKDSSITELEFRAAVAADKPVLVFLLDEDTAWPRSAMDKDSTRIDKLREELGRDWLASFFCNPQELATLVTTAVHNQLAGNGEDPPPGGGQLDPVIVRDYLVRIVQQYGRLDLEALTPAQYEDQLRVQLRSVFVEPDIREDLPVVDLPKRLQQWLAAQENLTEEDLPEGLTSAELDRLRDAYRLRPRRRVLDVLGASGAGQKIVLLGDPGAGKTSLARYLALSLADPEGSAARLAPFAGSLPLLVELKSYEAARSERGCQTLLEFLGQLARAEGLGLAESLLDRYLSHDGRAVAIFDGLDEIFDPAHRAAVTRQIAAFAARYPKVSVVVTSRIIGYSRATLTDADFTHATLQDLDTDQIRDFLAGWYALALQDRPAEAQARTSRLLAAISESRSIAEMAGNPLMLTILAIIGRHQELPRERWKVYDYAATVLVERWDVNRHLRDERLGARFIGEDDKKEMLRRIALRMQIGVEHGGNYLTGAQLQAEFEEYLRCRYGQDQAQAAAIARAMISEFRERNFILSRYGGELYGFVHRAFLEHLCAEAYRFQFEKDQSITIEQLKTEVYGQHWHDPAWREVLRLIAGTIREQWTAHLVTYLCDEVGWPWPWRFLDKPPWNIALAAQCVAEGKSVAGLENAGERVLTRVIQLLEHGNLDDNHKTSKLISDEIVPTLTSVGPAWPGREIYLRWYLARGIRLAWNPMAGLATHIATSLFPRHPVLVDALIDSIRSTHDGRLRATLLNVVASDHADFPEIRDLLIDRATADPNAVVRQAAVHALARLAPTDPEIRDLLLDRATTDPNADVQQTAMQAMIGRNSADSEIRDLLLNGATIETAAQGRQAAARALAGLASTDPEIRDLLLDRAATDTSAGAITDSSQVVRMSAVLTMNGLAPVDPKVRNLLQDRATADANPIVRLLAVLTLKGLAPADPRVRELLHHRATTDANKIVRHAALQGLIEFAPDFLVIRDLLLDRAANDTYGRSRQAAVRALAGLAPADSVIRDLLRNRAITDTDKNVRQAALHGLVGAVVSLPEVRDRLLRSSERVEDLRVGSADWVRLVSADLDDPTVRFVFSGGSNAADRDWLHQLVIRIATCSASFRPDAMPSIGSTMGP